MEKLSPQQRRVLELIHRYLDEQSVPPTRAEIAHEMGFRTANTAEFHLKALARKGAIELLPGRSRNIRLCQPRPRNPGAGCEGGIPLIGKVAAGQPILAVEHIESFHACRGLFSPPADFMLRVQGMSMRDADILDGDLLGVHKTPEARTGDIVVARLDDEVTVKTLNIKQNKNQKQNQYISLLPANAEFQPIEVDPRHQQFAIEGVVVGTVRQLRPTPPKP